MSLIQEPVILLLVIFALIAVVGRLLMGGGKAGGASAAHPMLRGAGRKGRREAHEFVPVDPSHDFPDADIDFYNNAGGDLAKLGFHWIGFIEDRTASELRPSLRTFQSVFRSGDGTVMASISHLRPKGFMAGQARAMGAGQGDLYSLDFITEFTDGTFLLTTASTLPRKREPREGITVRPLSADTPLHRASYMHQEAAGRILHAGDRLGELSIRNLADLMASFRRMSEIENGLRTPSESARAHANQA